MHKILKYIKELTKENFKWFEGNSSVFLTKILSVLVLYVFILEPLLFENFIKTGSYSFLKGQSFETQISYWLFISISCFFLGFIHGKMKPAFFSIIGSITVIMLIYAHLLSLIRYDLVPTGVCIKYLNLFFIAPLISSVTFLWYSKKKTPKVDHKTLDLSKGIKLNQELPLTELAKTEEEFREHDILGYYSLAEVVFDAITSLLDARRSFSIGLNGTWGSGKSFLIDIITDNLVSNHRDNKNKIRVIKFSPWLYPDEKSLVSNFFIKWKEALEESSMELEEEFEKYATLLTSMEIGVAGISTKIFPSGSKNLEQTKKNIIKYLEKPDIKEPRVTYLIIIDDLDRLRKKEILEVAKLSRVLADFPRTIYLLAYDRVYIDSILADKSTKKEHTYFDKIINLEFKLPQITESNLADYIENRILANSAFIALSEKPGEEVGDLKIIDAEIKRQLNIVRELGVYQHFLPTIRDVKRFVNSFLLKYRSLRRKYAISIGELLLLDMLFYRYKRSYESFYSQRTEIENALSGFVPDKQDLKLSAVFLTFKGESSHEKIDAVLTEIFKNKTPAQATMLVDYYYSYFGGNKFTANDLSHLLVQPPEKKDRLIKEVIINDNGYYLVREYIKRVKKEVFGNTLLDIVNPELREFRDRVNIEFLETQKTLSDAFEEQLSTDIAELYLELKIYSKATGNQATTNAINLCAELLTDFCVYKETFNNGSDEKRPKFKSQPVANKGYGIFQQVDIQRDGIDDLKGIDDHYYSKVLDLSAHGYEIKFVPPDIQHWRFGFKFSKSNNFPLRAFRHYNQYPIFHLGKDHDEEKGHDPTTIKVTAYNPDRTRVTDNDLLNKVGFVTDKSITFRLSYTDNAVNFEIAHDNKKDLTNCRLYEGYSKCMIFAWADAHKRNEGKLLEFETEIIEQDKLVFNYLVF